MKESELFDRLNALETYAGTPIPAPIRQDLAEVRAVTEKTRRRSLRHQIGWALVIWGWTSSLAIMVQPENVARGLTFVVCEGGVMVGVAGYLTAQRAGRVMGGDGDIVESWIEMAESAIRHARGECPHCQGGES